MLMHGLSLFFSCLLAATIIPFSSEALLISAIEVLEMPTYIALAFAAGGNISGCIINYIIGRYGSGWVMRKLGINSKRLDKWHARFEKYDKWVWAANWIPIIGDPITIYAGVVKLNFKEFLLWTIPLRVARYFLIIHFWEFLYP